MNQKSKNPQRQNQRWCLLPQLAFLMPFRLHSLICKKTTLFKEENYFARDSWQRGRPSKSRNCSDTFVARAGKKSTKILFVQLRIFMSLRATIAALMFASDVFTVFVVPPSAQGLFATLACGDRPPSGQSVVRMIYIVISIVIKPVARQTTPNACFIHKYSCESP